VSGGGKGDPKHLQKLNPEQYEAVASVNGPMLILAGAGSGKTRVLTRRIAHLLHLGVDPKRILAMTFTNKAATEMKERVAELVGGVARDVLVATFHSAAMRFLREDIEPLGWTRRFAIWDDDDQLRLVKLIIKDHEYDPEVVVARQVMSKIDWYKNRLMAPNDVLSQMRAHGADPMIRVWREYENALKAADALDFNDLIGHLVRLFREHPPALEKWQAQFEYILVDEYQDTNHAQYLLLRLLAEKHKNLSVVGDDDQSIYGFRGAEVANILRFEKDFPNTKVVRLEQNYRCSNNILAVANAVVEKTPGRLEKRLWSEAPAGPKVSVVVAEDPADEAKWVVRAIKALHRSGQHKWSDFAIIYRTNAMSQPFETELRAAQVPHKVFGGRKFYSQREIRDVLSFMRLLSNPADDAAMLRVVNVPPRGIGVVTVTSLRDDATSRGEPLFAAARSRARGSGAAATALAGFVGLIDNLTEDAGRLDLGELVHKVVTETGYLELIHKDEPEKTKERLDRLNTLVREAGRFVPEDGAEGLARLNAWLDRLQLASSGDDEAAPSEAAVLMTVHSSKGLEFPVVFVVQMQEGSFPHSRSLDGGVDEERRLAYVAFTRAQKRLIITRSRTAEGSSGPQPVAPSRFLYGLPPAVCEGELPSGEEPDAVEEEDDGDRVRRFVAHHRARTRPTPAPKEASTDTRLTMELEELEQLRPGVRVVHRKFGDATVYTLHPRQHPPMVELVLDRGGHKKVPVEPSQIRLLRE
jgi:DNA helicase-2/ATP-dependent DNA helicase PcrA